MLLKILQISQKTLCRNFFLIEFRWSQRRCSIKRAILKHFAIFMGKHFCWSLFLIKLQTFRPATLLKRNSNAVAFLWILRNFKEHLFTEHPWTNTYESFQQVLSCVIYKFLRTLNLKNICERLLLKPVLSAGLPFLIIYTSGSNWYLSFSFYMISYSLVCQFSLHYYWYCYNQG